MLVAIKFIDYACHKITNQGWSPDAVVGFSREHAFRKNKSMVSTKTLYNYIVQCLLVVRNIDLPMKKKLNTKAKRVRKHRRVLGTSIAECPPEIEDREEFGHWEIDTVEGNKSDDNAVLTLLECNSSSYYTLNIDDQEHDSVDYSIKQLQNFYGVLFPKIFKTITADNESEFSNLSASLEGVTDDYFDRPYASYERGSNERHSQGESNFRLL